MERPGIHSTHQRAPVLQTDAPWCDIRPSHAGYAQVQTHRPALKAERFERGSMVKGRNEPCQLQQVLEVVASALGRTLAEVRRLTGTLEGLSLLGASHLWWMAPRVLTIAVAIPQVAQVTSENARRLFFPTSL